MILRNIYLIGLLTCLLISASCSLPFGLDLDQRNIASLTLMAQPNGEIVFVPTETPTPTPTPTPSFTPTPTPESTPTSTLVVPPTDTPSPTATRIVNPIGQLLSQIQPSQSPPAAFAPPPVSEISPPAASVFQAQPIVLPASTASPANVIVNGNFEQPWLTDGVAPGWSAFDSGTGIFGWHRERWFKVVKDGNQSQLIAIMDTESTRNQFAGIYQTLTVVAGAGYELTIQGLIRSDAGSNEESGYNYLLQYGIDYGGGQNWQAVAQWVDLPFPEYPRQDLQGDQEYRFETMTTYLIPLGQAMTLFIRGMKKWPDPHEVNFDVDGISLRGVPQPQAMVRNINPVDPSLIQLSPSVAVQGSTNQVNRVVPNQNSVTEQGQVVRVVDGDTIDVLIKGQRYRVRYILINTPETKHPTKGVEPFGPEAYEANKNLVEGRTVTLEKDVSETDQYDRLLRYVYVGNLLVNEELLRLGLARVVRYPPDLKYANRFLAIQRQAQADGIGLWAD